LLHLPAGARRTRARPARCGTPQPFDALSRPAGLDQRHGLCNRFAQLITDAAVAFCLINSGSVRAHHGRHRAAKMRGPFCCDFARE
jgi:hypothetical protein